MVAKKEISRKRMSLLLKQENLSESNCKSCEKENLSSVRACVGCEVYEQLNAIGKELESIAKSKREGKFEVLKADELTVEVYRELKEQELRDREIAKRYGMHINKLNVWKRENGLVRPNVPQVNVPVVQKEESKSNVEEELRAVIKDLEERLKMSSEEMGWRQKAEDLEVENKQLNEIKNKHILLFNEHLEQTKGLKTELNSKLKEIEELKQTINKNKDYSTLKQMNIWLMKQYIAAEEQ